MIVLFVVAALLVIGVAVALAFGGPAGLSVHRSEPVSSAGGRGLPPGDFTSDDAEHVRFDVALRGYRMDQVDAAIDALRRRLAELEADAHAPVGQGISSGSYAVFPRVPGPGSQPHSPYSPGQDGP